MDFHEVTSLANGPVMTPDSIASFTLHLDNLSVSSPKTQGLKQTKKLHCEQQGELKVGRSLISLH